MPDTVTILGVKIPLANIRHEPVGDVISAYAEYVNFSQYARELAWPDHGIDYEALPEKSQMPEGEKPGWVAYRVKFSAMVPPGMRLRHVEVPE